MTTGSRSTFAAALSVAALTVHELAFVLAGAERSADHGYLATLAPMLIAIAVASGLTAVLLPSLGRIASAPRMSPLPVAAALVAIFICQEAGEALLGGGGPEVLADSLTAAWSLPALALAAAAAIVGFVSLLHRMGEGLASLLVFGDAPSLGSGFAATGLPAQGPRLIRSPMAFCIACRPPPVSA